MVHMIVTVHLPIAISISPANLRSRILPYLPHASDHFNVAIAAMSQLQHVQLRICMQWHTFNAVNAFRWDRNSEESMASCRTSGSWWSANSPLHGNRRSATIRDAHGFHCRIHQLQGCLSCRDAGCLQGLDLEGRAGAACFKHAGDRRARTFWLRTRARSIYLRARVRVNVRTSARCARIWVKCRSGT